MSSLHRFALVALLAVAGGDMVAQPSDPQLEALKRSQFCRRAAEEFMGKPEWKPQNQMAVSQTFTSHYNTRLKRCLVQVPRVQFSDKPKQTIELLHVYDALDGKTLGGKVITRWTGAAEPVVRSIALVREGRFIRDASEAAVMMEWFDGLMVE